MNYSSDNSAVCINSVHKSYGFGKAKTRVLQNLDLCVLQGSIYGLVGPSGSGKTTTLKCVIGRVCPDGGSIHVLGITPKSKLSKILASNVGYMPQEIELFGHLTAVETLAYFGRLFMMKNTKIRERAQFLLEFLNLSQEGKLIKTLSTGQQRLVSFAIALLHEPSLLVLDEPTIGVDPIIKTKIWSHLLQISQSHNVSIIIASQCIEEACKANKVGLIRNGKILAEDNPSFLMNHYELKTLEDVFILLSQNNHETEKKVFESKKNGRNGNNYVYIEKTDENCDDLFLEATTLDNVATANSNRKNKSLKSFYNKFSLLSWQLIFAVARNYVIKYWRQPSILLAQVLLPSIQILLVCWVYSKTPHSLDIAVVNEDRLLGIRFVSLIDNNSIHQIPVANTKVAENMVINREALGYIHIWKNFSWALFNRVINPIEASTETIDSSIIHLNVDMTNQYTAYTIVQHIAYAYLTFIKKTVVYSKIDPILASLPIQIDKIHGSTEPDILEYITPGIILIVSHFLALSLIATDFTMIKKGLQDRSYVSGLTKLELICGHFLSHLGILIVGVASIVLTISLQLQLQENLVLLFFLTLLQVICGMTYDYLIAILLVNDLAICVIGSGSLIPITLFTGLFMPIEALPAYLQSISNFLPQTHVAYAIRCIITHGNDITYKLVWKGFAVTLGWIGSLIIIMLIVIKIKKY